MAVSKLTLATSYTARNGDYLLLPFCNGKKSCFPKSLLPKDLAAASSAPEDAGGSRIAWCGPVGKARVTAVARRLDGKDADCRENAACAISTAIEAAGKEKAKRVVVLLDGRQQEIRDGVFEGVLLGSYAFDKYLSKKAARLPVVLVTSGSLSTLRRELAEKKKLYGCVNFARDVLNEPPNVRTPLTLAADYRRFGKASGLKITVWDEKRLAKERCGGILGVGSGAKAAPRLVMGEYKPARAKKHLCLVGKGVTFDSGGYCLKPGASQVGMKLDMGGSAMCFAAACAIARLKLPIRVTLITPLVENRISDRAYLTTSILQFRNGKTTQVDNTDAEGRLILADALCLAAEKKPDWIVDAATLTGACVVALGEEIAGAFGTDKAFTRQLIDAGEAQMEPFWELPLYSRYSKLLETAIADSKNIGGKWGGAITAALFLQQFVPEDQAWIHCDIAGPGIQEKPSRHLGKGAKGFGVKTLVELAGRLAKVKRQTSKGKNQK